MKNILVTGANGQLGNEMRVLSAEYKEYTCFFTDVAELDICDEQALLQLQKEYCDKKDCLRCRFGFEYLRQK